MLQERDLLVHYFDRLLEVLTLVEFAYSNNKPSSFSSHTSSSLSSSSMAMPSSHDTSLAWDLIDRERVSVLVYGESGAGKSLLVRTLTGAAEAASSHTGAGTSEDRCFATPSGVDFIDTPGVKIPLELAESASHLAWLRDLWGWRALLGSLKERLFDARSGIAAASTRPVAVVYVHRASSRVVPGRIAELLSLPHHGALAPTFLVLSDVCGVDDAALAAVRGELAALLDGDALGHNSLGRKVQLIEVNTETKIVSGHRHLSKGLPELVAALLTSLDPVGCLAFTKARSAAGAAAVAAAASVSGALASAAAVAAVSGTAAARAASSGAAAGRSIARTVMRTAAASCFPLQFFSGDAIEADFSSGGESAEQQQQPEQQQPEQQQQQQ